MTQEPQKLPHYNCHGRAPQTSLSKTTVQAPQSRKKPKISTRLVRLSESPTRLHSLATHFSPHSPSTL